VLLDFYDLGDLYQDIILIVSPPRCSSTALARVFWEHPKVRYYSHEPFETRYYQNEGLEEVTAKLRFPLDLGKNRVKRNLNAAAEGTLVIKEMPYQVGKHFKHLLKLVTRPVIFLMRDPRLNIASRMKKKLEVGQPAHFPTIETGWEMLQAHIQTCESLGRDFILVDSHDFRNHPEYVLKKLFSVLKMPFNSQQTTWKSDPKVDLDNLGGQHSHLYDEVLGSSSLLPDVERIPSMETFPLEDGFRYHVQECLQIYRRLRKHPALIRATA
jgi:hypothetical protein